MTVYVTAQELLDLEHARLALRAEHGLAVDRGRLVREALAPGPRRPRAERRVERPGPPAHRGMTTPPRSSRRRARLEQAAGVRAAPRQLRGPLRPAAQPDLQAQARHHRGRALAGSPTSSSRTSRPAVGRTTGTSSRPRRSCWSPPPCSTSRPPGCCRRATSRTRRTSRCSRRATCCSRGCCSTARSSSVAAVLEERLAGESRRHPRAVGLEERFASLLPEVLIGIGLDQFARARGQGAGAQAGARGRPAATSTPPG